MTRVSYKKYVRISFAAFADDLVRHGWGSVQEVWDRYYKEGGSFRYHPAAWGNNPATVKLSISTWNVVLADPQGRLWVCKVPPGIDREDLPALRAAINWEAADQDD